MTMLSTVDAYTPREIAHKIETLGVTKVRSDTVSLLLLPIGSQDTKRKGPIQCRERLGGLLKYYEREAA